MRRLVASVLLTGLCISCAPAGGASQSRFARSLKPVAQPSEVIATELAFARAAQDDGQWTAFAKYAADGALIFGNNGAFEAKPWLKAQKNPPESVRWDPHAVWSSCDGSLAVTRLGFAYPGDDPVGIGYTVWQRQKKGDYRYLFDFGWPTPVAEPEPDIIQAKVADCARDMAIADAAKDVRRSQDGTLQWSFAFTSDGTRKFTVWMLRDGEMSKVASAEILRQGD